MTHAIRKCDLLAFDTIPPSGECCVMTSVHAVVEERWTVSEIHRRAWTAKELQASAAPGSGMVVQRA
jgi:hypothetical protein